MLQTSACHCPRCPASTMRTAEEEALKIPEFYTYESFSSIVLFLAVRHDSATCHMERERISKIPTECGRNHADFACRSGFLLLLWNHLASASHGIR